MKKQLLSILFWSVISAAFIGPGTITTASGSGSAFGLNLLLPLLISIVATVVLQTLVVELKLKSGKSLGVLFSEIAGPKRKWLAQLVLVSVIIGCIAYEAGNILGAVAGLQLVWDLPAWTFTILITLIAFLLLKSGNVKWVANAMGLLVVLMAIAFGICAFKAPLILPSLKYSVELIFSDTQALLLSMALIGTTVVPYNIFLASGLSKSGDFKTDRIGITLAVIIGGLITIAVMQVGTLVSGDFSFAALAGVLRAELGTAGHILFAIGLFAAGLSSAITAPLAAALTARSFYSGKGSEWEVNKRNFKAVWLIVLISGISFGLLELKPVPIIVLAQALNGFILPLIAVFLIKAYRKYLQPGSLKKNTLRTVILISVVFLLIFLGVKSLVALIDSRIFSDIIPQRIEFILAFIMSAVITIMPSSWFPYIKN